MAGRENVKNTIVNKIKNLLPLLLYRKEIKGIQKIAKSGTFTYALLL